MQHQQYAQARLSQLAYFILGCLSHGPRDAVALCEAIEQAESLYIEPGTLCRVLAQLEQRGRIAGDDGGERLRRYHITALGMLALQQAGAKYQRNQEQQEQNERSPGLLGGKEIIMRLVMWMLRLYPPAWRERYEGEMAALLEQHEITLWTVVDLLVGALDARLDPHYHRARQLLPLRRFQSSWRLLVAGFVVFWIALLPWFWMSVLGIDDARCETWSNSALCVMRKMVNVHQPQVPSALVGIILAFLPILLLLFMTTLTRAHGRKARTHLLLAAGATVGMLVLCIACGIWLSGIWQLFPQIGQFYPLTPAGLVIGIVGMGLATTLAAGFAAACSAGTERAGSGQSNSQGGALYACPGAAGDADGVAGRCGHDTSIPT